MDALHCKCSMWNRKRHIVSSDCVCAADLHANDGVDKEKHGDEQADVGQCFEGLHKGPQKNPDGVTLSQQFDQTSSSKQLQETHVERTHYLEDSQEKGLMFA